MTTPVKYRDRLYAAIVHYEGRLKRTARQRHDAHEDLMAAIDAVLEDVSAPPDGRRVPSRTRDRP